MRAGIIAGLIFWLIVWLIFSGDSTAREMKPIKKPCFKQTMKHSTDMFHRVKCPTLNTGRINRSREQ